MLIGRMTKMAMDGWWGKMWKQIGDKVKMNGEVNVI